MTVGTSKEALRERLRERLAALEPGAAAGAAQRVAERVLALPELARARQVATCLSFGSELDTAPLLERLRAAGRELWVPRADARDRQLHWHRYPSPLVTLSFGLRQPPRDTPELAAEAIDRTLDAVLVLGLAFDRRGYRLGHGSGYFDRFLAGRQLPAIGLGYDFQLLDEIPAARWDVPMSVVVTESEVCRPASGSAL